jgi:hypothetical protein
MGMNSNGAIVLRGNKYSGIRQSFDYLENYILLLKKSQNLNPNPTSLSPPQYPTEEFLVPLPARSSASQKKSLIIHNLQAFQLVFYCAGQIRYFLGANLPKKIST